MKLPFSYRQQFFTPILMISVIGHGLFLGGQGLWPGKPQYAVTHGKSSMEVVLLKETKPEPVKPPDQILTAKSESDSKVELELKKKEVTQKIPEKPVFIPKVQGSVSELLAAHLKNPAPPYPYLARQNGWEGVVLLDVTVSRKGNVESIRVAKSSQYKILDEAALKTVRKWNFLPARMAQFSFSSSIQIPIRFVLDHNNR